MKLPGFTAESSLGRPSKVYLSLPFAASKFGRQMPNIMPAQTEAAYAGAEEIDDTEVEQFDETPEIHEYGVASEVADEEESGDDPNDGIDEDAGEPEDGYAEEAEEG
jgi:hypothetical protein